MADNRSRIANAPVIAQAFFLSLAGALAIFAPQPGSASRLVPLGSAHAGDAARWAGEENAQLIAFDAQSGGVTVIAPTTLSLMRALSYGFLPLAGDISSCGPVVTGTPTLSDEEK